MSVGETIALRRNVAAGLEGIKARAELTSDACLAPRKHRVSINLACRRQSSTKKKWNKRGYALGRANVGIS